MTETTEQLTPRAASLKVQEPLLLECGETLHNIRIAYTTLGKLNTTKSNVVWVFHALTANGNPAEWWPELVGTGKALDPDKYFIICANMLGSCYGTTGPKNREFPLVTVHDMVEAHKILQKHLGIQQIYLGLGGSMGGQQLLEWAVQEPELFDHIAPMATNAFHSPWGIAFNEAQRMALENIDSAKGLEAARAIAMLSYRHYDTYQNTQLDVDQRWDDFAASSYQRYQGEKLRKRFSVHSYYYLSKAMDSHHIGRHFGSAQAALQRIRSKALVIGIDSDILFPPAEQKFLADNIPGAKLEIVSSQYGHDGFLTESETITKLLKDFLS
ncbi:homoserine O-acetyltransferase family protein [Marinoscillum furvescens]|uniref:Homoserine O-acetyltransferase n=1 Tax=Marinoscillum furvescens DSM 4134 TaxID=1122208 RepID=A0A3D9L4J2_MARFU|nr:homoserine O-acetyltransferase [Marinoscillum furvescens]RED99847.1 homoserine O-acetyltransferase [Marinoscillum furvescens DSM 4134]